MRLGWLEFISSMKGTSLQGEEREARLESRRLHEGQTKVKMRLSRCSKFAKVTL